MKKFIFVLLSFLFIISAVAQSRSDMPGLWKATVKAGEKPTTPTYIFLNADGTYLWGVDSTGNSGTGNITKGKWDFTMDSNIKLIPEDPYAKTVYYVKSGDNLFKYEFYDLKGVKTKDKSTDMDLFLERVSN